MKMLEFTARNQHTLKASTEVKEVRQEHRRQPTSIKRASLKNDGFSQS